MKFMKYLQKRVRRCCDSHYSHAPRCISLAQSNNHGQLTSNLFSALMFFRIFPSTPCYLCNAYTIFESCKRWSRWRHHVVCNPRYIYNARPPAVNSNCTITSRIYWMNILPRGHQLTDCACASRDLFTSRDDQHTVWSLRRTKTCLQKRLTRGVCFGGQDASTSRSCPWHDDAEEPASSSSPPACIDLERRRRLGEIRTRLLTYMHSVRDK